MRSVIRPLLAACLVVPLAGCPAFWVERGELVRPAATIDRPEPAQLPKLDEYVELQSQWRRETRVGLGGHVSATLLDPRLSAAEVAHQAAVNNLRPEAVAALLATTWDTRYGRERDRFPIDLEWRFDQQFISKSAILQPSNWAITLYTSGGAKLVPLETSVLAASDAPKGGFWEGRVRLWFPYRDPDSRRRLLGADTDWVSLELKHPSGEASLTWRFASVY